MQASKFFALALSATVLTFAGAAQAAESPNVKSGEKYAWEKNQESTPALGYYRSVTGGEKYVYTFDKTFPQNTAATPKSK